MNYSELSNMLTASLGLRQPPVAISFAAAVPQGVPPFEGRVAAGCRFWEDAAAATFATTSRDHELCAIGVYTHNLETSPAQQTDLMDELGIFKQLGYVTDADLPLIPVLTVRPKHVIYSPLALAPLAPDVVVLFVNASQTLILSEATSQVENQNAPAMGRPACAVVAQVMNSRRAAMSLGCCGARAYLDSLDESTAIFAIPGVKLEAYTQRIDALAKANSLLSKFHQLRRRDISAGAAPAIKDSLGALSAV